jgi:hypothetical protein
MSVYRDRSAFDPNAGDGDGIPAPPTWMQRIGIACLFVGAAVVFAYLAGKWGISPEWFDSPIPGTMIVILAGPLMGSGPLSAETGRRRLFIIAAALAVCAMAAATIFYFKGA